MDCNTLLLTQCEILHSSVLSKYALTIAIKIQQLYKPLLCDTSIYCLSGFSEAFLQ